jgi:hypothetical protein
MEGEGGFRIVSKEGRVRGVKEGGGLRSKRRGENSSFLYEYVIELEDIYYS